MRRRIFSGGAVALALLLAFALKAAGVGHDAARPAAPFAAAGSKQDKDGKSEIQSRDAWFYGQRAYPQAHTPQGALTRARVKAKKLEKRPSASAPRPAGSLGGTGVAAASTALAAGLTWTPLGPHPISTPGDIYQGNSPVSGRVTAIAPVSSTTAYVGGAAGGVWKTIDGGANWTPVFDGQASLAIGAITVDPGNSNTVWVGTGESNQALDSYLGQGLYRSTDAGATWSKVGGTRFDNCHIGGIALLPSNTVVVAVVPYGKYYVGCSGGVYRSTDGGTTWTQPLSGGAVFSLSSNGSTVYAGAQGGLWRSTNAGLGWTFLDGTTNGTGLPTSDIGRVAVAVAPTNANRVYAALERNSTGDFLGLYTSADGGATWTASGTMPDSQFCNVGGGGQCWYDLTLAVSPTDASTFYAAGIKLYTSTTAAATMNGPVAYNFAPAGAIHVDYHALAFDPSGNLWVGTDGGAYRIAAGTSNVANLNNDLELSEFQQGISGSVAPGAKLLGGLQDDGSLQYTGSTTWSQIYGGDGGATAIDPATSTRYVSYVFGTILRSVAGGGFVQVTSGINRSDPVEFYAPLVMDPSTPSTLYMGTNKVYRTTNSATNWTAISPFLGTTSSAHVTAIGPSKSNSSTVYAGTGDGQIKVTTDGGTSWSTNGVGIPNRYVTDIEVSPTNAQVAYATFSGFGSATPGNPGHVYRTTDGGGTWTSVSGNLPDSPANAIVVDYRFATPVLYVGTDVGVFTSTDGGTTWSNVSSNAANSSSGLPNAIVTDLILDPATNTLLAATHGRGMFSAPAPAPAASPPTVTSFLPTSGGAGTSVVVTGTNLAGATAVKFNGTASTSFAVDSATQITATVPDGATTGPISVTTAGGTGASSGSFTVLPTPTITSFDPGSGGVGTQVTIAGTNLTGTTSVTFNGTSAGFSGVTATSITTTVPAGATSGPIAVTTPGGVATSATSFTVVAAPTITDFSPTSGGVGTSVLISGTGFTGATAVKFAGTAASFDVQDDGDISATVPSGAATGTISVTTPGGTATSDSSFTVVPAPIVGGFVPTSGEAGTSVTISGSHFDGASDVSFNGTPAAFDVVSSSEIDATVPDGATTGPISVTTDGGVGTSAASFAVTSPAEPPTVTGFTPTSGPPGTVVTVTGTHLDTVTEVDFDGTQASFTPVSATELHATVPADATTGPISVTGPGGTADSADDFTVTVPPPSAPVVSGFAPTHGSEGDEVTIDGSGFTDATGVTFNGQDATDFTVESDTKIVATVPDTTTGPIAVTTANGTGASATNFVVDHAVEIDDVTPDTAAPGAAVTITGHFLTGTTSVKFGAVDATFTVDSDTKISTTVPAAATSGTLTVTNPSGSDGWDFVVLPKIASFAPTSGAPGMSVTITGGGFANVDDVTFGGASASFFVDSATQITAVVPLTAANGAVVVTTEDGVATSATSFTIAYPKPTLASFAPGTAAAGDDVTVTGTGFYLPVSVAFGGVAAAHVTVDSATQLRATVPADAPKSSTVAVTTNGGSASGTSMLNVKPSVTMLAPSSGPPGTAVTVTGTAFSGVTAVRVNGVTASFTVQNAKQLRLTVPPTATTGPVTVTTSAGTGQSGASFAVTPKVTGFSPASAAVGSKVTIGGSAFAGATGVVFGGVSTVPLTVTSTAVTAIVPSGAATGPVAVVTPAGSGSSTGVFKVLPKLTLLAPLAGKAGDEITLAGTGFTNVQSVKINNVVAPDYDVDSPTQIRVRIPGNATGGRVAVTTAGGVATSTASLGVAPTITGYSPGQAAAGAAVIVTGTGFGGISSVKLGGLAAAFSVSSATQLKLTVPTAATTGAIAVANAAGTATSGAPFVVLPKITSFTPASSLVGATVKISGTGLGGATSVLFGGVLALPTAGTATSVTVTVPADAVTGPLQVITDAGPSAPSASTFKVLPKLLSVGAASGVAGDHVTLTGSGFAGATAVKFGTVTAGFDVTSATQIDATVPDAATTGKITVVSAGGSSVAATTFGVAPRIGGFAPAGATRGAVVVVNGTGFGGLTAVRLGGVTASYSVVSPLQLKLTVPTAASTGTIQIANAYGSDTSADPLVVLPKIVSFTPTSAATGTTIKLTGTGLADATSVVFAGGASAVPVATTSTTVTVAVPADAGTGPLAVVTAAGTSPPSTTVLKVVPKLTGFLPGSGSVGSSVVLSGTGLTNVSAVRFGTKAAAFTADSAAQITATVPAGAVTGKITVVTAGGTAVTATSFTVTP